MRPVRTRSRLATFFFSRALFDQEKFAEAATVLRQAIQLDPSHAWAPSLLERAVAKPEM
jgi:TolA-binding protein